MNMGVHNGLPCRYPAVDANVESGDVGIAFQNSFSESENEDLRISSFFRRQGEEIRCMAPGDDEHMVLGYRVTDSCSSFFIS